ncbi:hypothetical protein AB0N62_39215 [Streptomyces sp. NPDC093982]|uniref:hypothetical protein n=1 Tax=Streptomyces sp. NPDC093982 TaxID=3155077 RepID=UPI00343BC1AC
MTISNNQRGRHRKLSPIASPKSKRYVTAMAATLAVTGGIQLAAATTSSAEVNPIENPRTGKPMFTAPAPGTKSLFYKFDPSVNERGREITAQALGNWNSAVHHTLFTPAVKGQPYQTLVNTVKDGGVSYSAPYEPITISPSYFEDPRAGWDRVHKEEVVSYWDGKKWLKPPPGKLVAEEGYGDSQWNWLLSLRGKSGSIITSPEQWEKYRHDHALRAVAHEAGHHLGLDHPVNATGDEVMYGGDTRSRSTTDVDGKSYHGIPTGPNRLEAAQVMRNYGIGDSNSTPTPVRNSEKPWESDADFKYLQKNYGYKDIAEVREETEKYFQSRIDAARRGQPTHQKYQSMARVLDKYPIKLLKNMDAPSTENAELNRGPGSGTPQAAQPGLQQVAGTPATSQGSSSNFKWTTDHFEYTGAKDPHWAWEGDKEGGGRWTYNPSPSAAKQPDGQRAQTPQAARSQTSSSPVQPNHQPASPNPSTPDTNPGESDTANTPASSSKQTVSTPAEAGQTPSVPAPASAADGQPALSPENPTQPASPGTGTAGITVDSLKDPLHQVGAVQPEAAAPEAPASDSAAEDPTASSLGAPVASPNWNSLMDASHVPGGESPTATPDASAPAAQPVEAPTAPAPTSAPAESAPVEQPAPAPEAASAPMAEAPAPEVAPVPASAESAPMVDTAAAPMDSSVADGYDTTGNYDTGSGSNEASSISSGYDTSGSDNGGGGSW